MKITRVLKNSCLKVKEKRCIINCVKGSIWITYPGSNDILLCDNENITIIDKTKIIIQGLENSSLTIETAIS